MGDFVSMIILAIIQGIAEWFPISSSGHLVLFSYILNFENTIQFDVALHFGTLMAVFVYFGRDIVDIIEQILRRNWRSKEARLGFLLIVATIPAGIIGVLFNNLIEESFANLWIVAICFGITAMLLFIASIDFKGKKKEAGLADSFLIGISQAVAILPGISRSGATISTGLLRGLDEKTAVKFSFLMSIPVIFGAGAFKLGTEKLSADYLLPTFIAFAVGLLTIHLLLKILMNGKKNLRWFAWYCLLLALGLGIYLMLF